MNNTIFLQVHACKKIHTISGMYSNMRNSIMNPLICFNNSRTYVEFCYIDMGLKSHWYLPETSFLVYHSLLLLDKNYRSWKVLEVSRGMEFQSHRRNFNAISAREVSWRKWPFLSGMIYWPLFPIEWISRTKKFPRKLYLLSTLKKSKVHQIYQMQKSTYYPLNNTQTYLIFPLIF